MFDISESPIIESIKESKIKVTLFVILCCLLCTALTYGGMSVFTHLDDGVRYFDSSAASKPLETLDVLDYSLIFLVSWFIVFSLVGAIMSIMALAIGFRHTDLFISVCMIIPLVLSLQMAYSANKKYDESQERAIETVQSWAHDRYGVNLSRGNALDVLESTDTYIPVNDGLSLHDMTVSASNDRHTWVIVKTAPQTEAPVK